MPSAAENAGAVVAPVSAGAPILRLHDVDVHYGKVQALRNLSLQVSAGEMVALVGANGAGKTTLLRAVSGLVTASSGSIIFDGTEVTGMAPQRVVRLGIAHVPEGRELFPTMSVLENLQLGHWTRRSDSADLRERRDEVMEFFPKLRARAGQAAGTLSGGEQQMLVIARALMSSPRLMLVDELSLGLAPQVVQQLFQILHEVNARGTAILLVEQFVHMALEHTQRAYVLAKGSVVIEGVSQELGRDEALVAAYLGGVAARE
jgi:branched-chain amino acid transport system ATP-binding protein